MKTRIPVLLLCLLSSLPFAQGKEGVQWRVAELSFRADKDHEKPYADVRIYCTLKGPDNVSLRIAGFYDGEKTWKVRFCPTAPGEWTWQTECEPNDAGLHGKSGRLLVKAPAETEKNPVYRHGGLLKVSSDRRHLTFSDGKPFFWLGDTWWFCPGPLMPLDGSSKPGCDSTFRTLVEKRKSQGFNVVHLAAMTRNPVDPEKAGTDYNSHYFDFIKTKTGGKFDVEMWRIYDRYIEVANEAGIVPVIGVAFHVGLDPYTAEELQYLWQYMIARFGSHAVSWLICGEYNRVYGDHPGRIEKVFKLGEFIKREDPYKRAMSVHPWYFGGDKKEAWKWDWCDFVMIQSGHIGHGKSPWSDTYKYAATSGKPFLESETQYEDIYGNIDADDVRHSAWLAVQWGSFGYTYGAQGIWYPKQDENDDAYSKTTWGVMKPWWVAMEFEGPNQLKLLKDFYESLDWTILRPRPDLLKIEGETSDLSRPILQADASVETAIVYFPKSCEKNRTFKFAAPLAKYRAEWFDPRTGERTETADVVVLADGVDLPDRPDDEDWVLTLRRTN